MKNTKRFLYILIGFSTVLTGIFSAKPFDGIVEIGSKYDRAETLIQIIKPRFIYLGGNNFKSAGSKPVFSDDCIGCGELGDINVYHNSESAEMTEYTFNANCNGKSIVVEKGLQLDENGNVIGKRCIMVLSDDHSRIVWTESEKDVWIMSAPTAELVKEFEKSEVYKSYKSTTDR